VSISGFVFLPTGSPSALSATARAGAGVWQFSGLTGNAQYTVRLYFAEIDSSVDSAGDRLFDVKIEGNVALDDIDIYNEAGGRDIGIAKSFSILVSSDGILEIEFIGANALVSGIEILAS
jgi:hypothetical protein